MKKIKEYLPFLLTLFVFQGIAFSLPFIFKDFSFNKHLAEYSKDFITVFYTLSITILAFLVPLIINISNNIYQEYKNQNIADIFINFLPFKLLIYTAISHLFVGFSLTTNLLYEHNLHNFVLFHMVNVVLILLFTLCTITFTITHQNIYRLNTYIKKKLTKYIEDEKYKYQVFVSSFSSIQTKFLEIANFSIIDENLTFFLNNFIEKLFKKNASKFKSLVIHIDKSNESEENIEYFNTIISDVTNSLKQTIICFKQHQHQYEKIYALRDIFQSSVYLALKLSKEKSFKQHIAYKMFNDFVIVTKLSIEEKILDDDSMLSHWYNDFTFDTIEENSSLPIEHYRLISSNFLYLVFFIVNKNKRNLFIKTLANYFHENSLDLHINLPVFSKLSNKVQDYTLLAKWQKPITLISDLAEKNNILSHIKKIPEINNDDLKEIEKEINNIYKTNQFYNIWFNIAAYCIKQKNFELLHIILCPSSYDDLFLGSSYRTILPPQHKKELISKFVFKGNDDYWNNRNMPRYRKKLLILILTLNKKQTITFLHDMTSIEIKSLIDSAHHMDKDDKHLKRFFKIDTFIPVIREMRIKREKKQKTERDDLLKTVIDEELIKKTISERFSDKVIFRIAKKLKYSNKMATSVDISFSFSFFKKKKELIFPKMKQGLFSNIDEFRKKENKNIILALIELLLKTDGSETKLNNIIGLIDLIPESEKTQYMLLLPTSKSKKTQMPLTLYPEENHPVEHDFLFNIANGFYKNIPVFMLRQYGFKENKIFLINFSDVSTDNVQNNISIKNNIEDSYKDLYVKIINEYKNRIGWNDEVINIKSCWCSLDD